MKRPLQAGAEACRKSTSDASACRAAASMGRITIGHRVSRRRASDGSVRAATNASLLRELGQFARYLFTGRNPSGTSAATRATEEITPKKNGRL
jgi:hypothetical protein